MVRSGLRGRHPDAAAVTLTNWWPAVPGRSSADPVDGPGRLPRHRRRGSVEAQPLHQPPTLNPTRPSGKLCCTTPAIVSPPEFSQAAPGPLHYSVPIAAAPGDGGSADRIGTIIRQGPRTPGSGTLTERQSPCYWSRIRRPLALRWALARNGQRTLVKHGISDGDC